MVTCHKLTPRECLFELVGVQPVIIFLNLDQHIIIRGFLDSVSVHLEITQDQREQYIDCFWQSSPIEVAC